MIYAVVQIRSTISAAPGVIDTLKMLHLHHVNNCTIIPQTKSYQGMLQKAKDYITWGEINEDTLKNLIKTKCVPATGNIDAFLKDLVNQKKKLSEMTNPTIKLHPPIKGYEGIKKTYAAGGSLGYRGDKINDLLKRMIS